MDVNLLTTPEHFEAMEHNAAYAMLICHANTDKLQHEPPRAFIERAIKAGHESILEHITLTYEVNNLSRACLQELARHRHISLSVESTRHTLKEFLSSEKLKIEIPDYLAGFYINQNDYEMDAADVQVITLIQTAKKYQESSDILKYFIPEFWPTNLVMTANVRELRHIVKLRTSPAALKEFQDLARKFVEVLHDDFKYLLEDCVHE